MLKLRWFILAGLTTYVVVLLASIPAHFLLELVPQIKNAEPVKIQSVSGTLWNGKADIEVKVQRTTTPIDAEWVFYPWKLLLGQVGMGLDVQGPGFMFEGSASVSPSTVSLAGVNGAVNTDLINKFAKPQGVEVAGKVDLTDVNIDFNYGDKIAEFAEGELNWAGGNVVYRQGGSGQNFDCPPLKGKFQENEGSLEFNVTDVDETKTYIAMALDTTGWGKVSVKKRVMELAGQTVAKRSADKAIFEVKHKVL